MKVAVIGTGFGARVVAPAFADDRRLRGRRRRVAARRRRRSRARSRRADVDLVSVHSPPFLHAAHVRAALAAGKAVLCDKPFALDADEAADARRRGAPRPARSRCATSSSGSTRSARLLRELVRTDALGPIEHVQWTHLSAGSRVPLRRYGWLFDRERGGGWIGAWGSHAVDTLRWCFGEVAAVDAPVAHRRAERPDDHGELHACTAEDGLTRVARASTPARRSAIDSSFAASAPVPPRLTVLGADAVCEIVGRRRASIVRRADGTRDDLTPAAPATRRGGDRHLDPMRRFAEVVRDVVTSGEVPPGVPTFADGHACDVVLDQLRAPRRCVTRER